MIDHGRYVAVKLYRGKRKFSSGRVHCWLVKVILSLAMQYSEKVKRLDLFSLKERQLLTKGNP